MAEYADVPDEIVAELRAACMALPEMIEVHVRDGWRWRIRNRTVADARTYDSPEGSVTIVMFRAPHPEYEVLLASGPPFFWPMWGKDVVGMVLDDATDWAEVTELLTDSYRVLAPKKLAARVGSAAD